MIAHQSLVAALAVAAVLAATTTAPGGPSLSNETDHGDRDKADAYTFVVTDQAPGTNGTLSTVDGGESQEPLFTMRYRVLDTDPATGEQCTRLRYVLGDDEAERGAAADAVRLAEEAYAAAAGDPGPPPCSGVVVDEGEVARTASRLVADELEPATPFVQPDNRAITGLRSFLTTNLESDRTETVSVDLFGRDWDVEVRIEGVHTIDWGDGTVDTDVSGDGGPWHAGPEQPGDIVHTYSDAGDHDLVVTTDWTVTATLAGTRATADQTLTTTSAPVTIDVDEVRSARDR